MSRYYDFDYDNCCIIGFGSDIELKEECYDIASSSILSGDSVGNSSLSQYSISDKQIEDDIIYILEADKDSVSSKKLKPLIVDDPFILVGDILKLQQIKQQVVQISSGDVMNLRCIDHRLTYKHNLREKAQQIARSQSFNGAYYNCFGSKIVSSQECHIWRLQVLGNVASIIGVIEESANFNKNGAFFGNDVNVKSYSFNTVSFEGYSHEKQPKYEQMLKGKKYEQPLLIDLKLNMLNGVMSITNVTVNDRYFGKEVVLFANIDTTKSYKLAFGLLGQEIINLF